MATEEGCFVLQGRRFEVGLPTALLTVSAGSTAHTLPSGAQGIPGDQLACSVCGRGFHGRNRRQDLERHMLTHTGEKPYQCPHCPHRTNRIGNLKTHVFAIHRDLVPNPARLIYDPKSPQPIHLGKNIQSSHPNPSIEMDKDRSAQPSSWHRLVS